MCHSSHRNRTTRGASGSAPVLHVCQDLEPDTCSADPCSLRRETTESAVIYRDMEGTLQPHTGNTTHSYWDVTFGQLVVDFDLTADEGTGVKWFVSIHQIEQQRTQLPDCGGEGLVTLS